MGLHFAFGTSKVKFLPSGNTQLEGNVWYISNRVEAELPAQVSKDQSHVHRSRWCLHGLGNLESEMQHHLFTLSQVNSAKGFAKGEHMVAKTGSVEKSSAQPTRFEEKTLILCIHTYS